MASFELFNFRRGRSEYWLESGVYDANGSSRKYRTTAHRQFVEDELRCMNKLFNYALATVPSKRLRQGYGAVNTISFSLSVTRLVLTPTPNPKRPTRPISQNFTTKWRGHFKTTDGGNGNVYANYHR